MDYNLVGQVGLVTGAGSAYGIGRSLVRQLAKAKASVIYACDLNLSHIDSLKESLQKDGSQTEVVGYRLDVSSEVDTVELLKKIIKKHGRFDFYFANAGYAIRKNVMKLEVAQYDRAVAVMQKSILLAIKYGSQAMAVVSALKPISKGCIIVTASAAGVLPSWSCLTYSTVKTAAIGLVRSGAVQLASSNIRVNGIAPGITYSSIFSGSEMVEDGATFSVVLGQEEIIKKHEKIILAGRTKDESYYHERIAFPEEIAEIGLFLVSDASKAINGQVILADSGKTGAALLERQPERVPPIEPLSVI